MEFEFSGVPLQDSLIFISSHSFELRDPVFVSLPFSKIRKLEGLREYAIRCPESLENLLLLAVDGFGDLPNLLSPEEWVKRTQIPKKEGYRKRNWFKRIHP